MAKKTRSSIGHVRGQPIPYINGHNRRKQERYQIEDRGYETPCWIWLLAKSQWGYGLEADGHRQQAAHRAEYKRRYGTIPDNLELDHLCRQRDCVNPDHLEPVTRAMNIQRGDLSQLTEPEVRAIKRMLQEGVKQKEIAQYFNVCRATISCIATGHTWRNVIAS